MCRIHLVLVLGSTKGLATTAIIPESIKKEKKNQKKKKKKKKKKNKAEGGGTYQEVAVPVVRSLA